MTTVCGTCFTHGNLKKYILWALKLLEDMPGVINKVTWLDTVPISP